MSRMGFCVNHDFGYRRGEPTFAPARTRLPHPSCFSKGEHTEDGSKSFFLTLSSDFWASFRRVPHSCAFFAQEWDSTEVSRMGFASHHDFGYRRGEPTFAPARTRLPHPSCFSKGEHTEDGSKSFFLTLSSAFWAPFTRRVPHSCAFFAQEWDSTEVSRMGSFQVAPFQIKPPNPFSRHFKTCLRITINPIVWIQT